MALPLATSQLTLRASDILDTIRHRPAKIILFILTNNKSQAGSLKLCSNIFRYYWDQFTFVCLSVSGTFEKDNPYREG